MPKEPSDKYPPINTPPNDPPIDPKRLVISLVEIDLQVLSEIHLGEFVLLDLASDLGTATTLTGIRLGSIMVTDTAVLRSHGAKRGAVVLIDLDDPKCLVEVIF